MPIGLGIGLNISMRGGLGGSGFSLTAPVATWISDAATAQAVFEIDVDSGVVSGDKIWGESSTDNFATILETVSAAIAAPDLADFQIDDFAFAPFTPDGTYYARFWVSNSADTQISPKSTAISLAIAATPWAPTDLGADLALWLDPSDLSTLFQSNAGSTAVTADGNVVGYAGDKSGDGFHFTSAADNTTRPLYKTAGGLHWLAFDGANDGLYRNAALGLLGNASVFFAVLGAPTVSRVFFGEANTGNGVRYDLMRANSVTASTADSLFRNSASSQWLTAGNFTTPSAFDSTDHVFGITDDGAEFKSYLDGTLVDTQAYTATGTNTPNKTSLGNLHDATGPFGARVYGAIVVKRVVTAQERADITTFLGAKMGLSL